jgi:hypothetical protein
LLEERVESAHAVGGEDLLRPAGDVGSRWRAGAPEGTIRRCTGAVSIDVATAVVGEPGVDLIRDLGAMHSDGIGSIRWRWVSGAATGDDDA